MRDLFMYWDKDFFSFDREVWGKCPYKFVYNEEDNTEIIVYDAVGVSKDNIKVNIKPEYEDYYLTLSGEEKNKYTGKTFSFSGRFKVYPDKIENIDVELENGLLYIKLKIKESEKPNININWQ